MVVRSARAQMGWVRRASGSYHPVVRSTQLRMKALECDKYLCHRSATLPRQQKSVRRTAHYAARKYLPRTRIDCRSVSDAGSVRAARAQAFCAKCTLVAERRERNTTASP